jgi:hypothetical protein
MDQNQQNPNFTPFIDENGEVIDGALPMRALQVIQSKDALAALVDQTSIPIHIRKMQEFKVSPEVMASYVNVPWVDAYAYINKVVKVIGCVIWFSGTFVPQRDPDILESGYHSVLIKLDETRTVKGIPLGDRVVSMEQNVIIKCSGKRVAEMALVYMNEHGWFDWKEGEFEWTLLGGNKDSGYLMQPVNSLVAKLQES